MDKLQINLFSCPICYEIPENELYQCQNGHGICKRCLSKSSSKCPQCRNPFLLETFIRNRPVEAILDSMTFDCPHKSKGCQERLPRGKISSHSRNCHYNVTTAKYFSNGLQDTRNILTAILKKNLIRNPSGKIRYDGWKITIEGGSGWTIEKSPVYCDQVPQTDFLGLPGNDDTYCFATSYGACGKRYMVDLNQEFGMLKNFLPFEIQCGQMYGTRGDCGGTFKWRLNLLDSNKKVLEEFQNDYKLDQGKGWKTATHVFKIFRGDRNIEDNLRYLEFYHEGQDNKFWAGYYGMKFARSTVVIVPVGQVEDHYKTKSSQRSDTKLPISVRTLDGKTYKIEASSIWLVAQLKKDFLKLYGKGAMICTLYHRARRLNDDQTLQSYSISAGDFLMANFPNRT